MLDMTTAGHHHWSHRLRRGPAAIQADYNSLVERTTVLRHFGATCVPGLLQTADYARRMLLDASELHDHRADEVDVAVATRLERQRYLDDHRRRFEFVLAEPVLRWRMGPPGTMQAQLDRLQSVLGRENVRLGIIPFEADLTTVPQNSFDLFDDRLAVVETFVGESTHTGAEAATYARALDRLWADAVTGEDARRLIAAAMPLAQGSGE
jgi:hypothetical protein